MRTTASAGRAAVSFWTAGLAAAVTAIAVKAMSPELGPAADAVANGLGGLAVMMVVIAVEWSLEIARHTGDGQTLRRSGAPAGTITTAKALRRNRYQDAIHIDIGTVFSRTPGPRYRSRGENSGEAFREDVLMPAARKAIKSDCVVVVDLGNIKGPCPIGWLSEVFGGTRSALGTMQAKKRIQIRGGPQATQDIADAYSFLTTER